MGFEEEEFDEDEEVEEKPVKKKLGKNKPGKKGSKKQEKPKEEYLVVKELPVQQVRSFLDEETGVTMKYLTIEESLTRMENKFKELTGGL